MMTREELLSDLNEQQRQAVEHRGGPLMVLAGPGSGKTRVITRRIVVSVLDGVVRPEQVLAVTFTNKAAEEMRERVAAMLGETERAPTIATFHSACVRILRIDGGLVGLPRAFSILDTTEVRRLIRDSLRHLQLPDEPKDIRQAASSISAFKNGRIEGDRVGPVLAEYLERCRLLGATDFDDLLLKTLQLLEEHPEARTRWQRRWQQILVDEYQDTNPVQARIVRFLISGSNPDLCVVGDPDQAIYGFRNASPRAFEELRENLPDVRVLQLSTNYRSGGKIVDLCRELISVSGGMHVDLDAGRAPGEQPELRTFGSDRQEAEWVVGRLAAAGSGAVLTRTNAQTRLFEEELMRGGVSYRTVGTLRFYDRAEVKDALSWLRAAVNRQDLLALARAAGSMPQGVGERTVQLLTEAVQRGSELEAAAAEAGRGRKAAEELLRKIADVKEQAGAGPRAALHHILHGIGLLEHSRRGEGGQERAENLEEILAAADGYESSLEGTENFLHGIALTSQESGDAAAQVLLMTAHAAKGREFPEVYVCGVENGLFPHSQANGAEEIGEERRLLYVACSRAQDRLILTSAERRFVHGQQQEQQLSFLIEPVLHLLRTTQMRTSEARSGGGYSPGRRTGGAYQPSPRLEPRRRGVRAASGPRIAPEAAKVGGGVEHEKFGAGRIVAVHGGENVDVEVLFESGGARRLRLDLAPMRVVPD